ncbi:MAG: porin family protein [Rhodothermales bacterium]
MKPLRLLLLLLPLLVGLDAQAQVQIDYGTFVGFSAARQSPGDDARTGFNLAGFVEVTPIPYAAAALEVAYVQKGQTFDGPLTQPDDNGDIVVIDQGTFTLALDYLSLGLAVKPSLPLGPLGSSVYAVAGPRLDVLLNEKLLFSGDEEDVRFNIEEHASTVWGYDVGAGLRFGTVLPVPLLVEVRFSGDLTEAYDGLAGRPDATKNQVMQIRVGVEI